MRSRLFVYVLILGIAGCSTKKGDQGSVRIQFPGTAETQLKVGALMSTYDWARACYVVNIAGSGITETTKSCDIPVSIFAGSVAPGGELSVDVPRGSARRLEVFAFLRPSSGEACPQLTGGFGSLRKDQIARIGLVSSFDVMADTVEVPVTVSAPNTGESLLTQYGLPNSCLPTSSPGTSPRRVSTGQATLQGSTLRVKGSVGDLPGAFRLQGTSLRITGGLRAN